MHVCVGTDTWDFYTIRLYVEAGFLKLLGSSQTVLSLEVAQSPTLLTENAVSGWVPGDKDWPRRSKSQSLSHTLIGWFITQIKEKLWISFLYESWEDSLEVTEELGMGRGGARREWRSDGERLHMGNAQGRHEVPKNVFHCHPFNSIITNLMLLFNFINDFPSLCFCVSFILRRGAAQLVVLPRKFCGYLLIGPFVTRFI